MAKAKQATQTPVNAFAAWAADPATPVSTSGRGFEMQATAGCGTPVTITHYKRRMYTVTVAGKVRGYVCSGDPANVVARVSATPLAALKLNTAKLQ